jgi:hypothetical protein
VPQPNRRRGFIDFLATRPCSADKPFIYFLGPDTESRQALNDLDW